MTNKLNYDNAAALINAFKQGAKFKIQRRDGSTEPVTKIEESPADRSRDHHGLRVTGARTGSWLSFQPDGVNTAVPLRLIRDESLGLIERTSVTVGDSIFGWVPPARRVVPVPAPAAEKPLLQRLLSGETFHNPKTRETLDSFLFSKGELVVALKGEDGKLRTSQNYDHSGKHKWRPERSLVAGPVPPKAKPDVAVDVYLFESKSQPGTFMAATLAQTISYSAWRQVGVGQVVAQGKQRA